MATCSARYDDKYTVEGGRADDEAGHGRIGGVGLNGPTEAARVTVGGLRCGRVRDTE